MIKPIDRIPGMKPNRREEAHPDGSVTVFVTPPEFMKKPEVSVKLTADQYRRYLEWREGRPMIQEALPELSVSEREKLMSGLGDDDFHEVTRDPEDD
jgi:hypothetical protein